MENTVCDSKDGLVAHIQDAIKLNRARSPHYAGQTGGKSKNLSDYFIRLQRWALPKAWWLDRKSVPFHKQGICIIQNDLISMSKSASKDQPLIYKAEISTPKWDTIADELKLFCKKVRALGTQGRFEEIAGLARQYRDYIENIESIWHSYLAMCKHLIESIGFMASNAVNYSEQTNGETRPLSAALINAHVAAIQYAVKIDIQAQPLHGMDCGIIVNDLPPVPFQ
jgi:hypothetical protein